MADMAPIIARALFWILAVAVVRAPRRWALLAFLIVVQIDVSGPGWASPTAVGLENTVKILILPLILLIRLGPWSVTNHLSRAFRLWLLFTGYVALASLWSPFQVSAAKMVVYLVSYAVIFLVFAEAWRQRLLDTTQVVAAVWASLAVAALQTYVLGNAFGTPPKLIIEQARFTTFSPPQSFAAFLVSMAALLVLARPTVTGRLGTAMLAATGAGIAVGLVLVGSRYVAVGTLLLLVIAGGLKGWRSVREQSMSRTALLRSSVAGALALVVLVGSVAAVAPNNRIFALRKLVAHGRLNSNAIGTFVWRLDAYQTAVDQIRERPIIEDVFGSGTSSAARAVLAFNPTQFHPDTIDANRSLHDEFLRAFYEWGAVGSILFLAFLAALIVGMLERTRRNGLDATQVFWGLLPTLFFALLVENVLAESGAPLGAGFVLVISYAAVAVRQEATQPASAPTRTRILQLIPALWR